jgi:transcriptional regulator with XRE-family HTH domain
VLELARCEHAFANCLRRLRLLVAAEFLVFDCRRFDVNIDAVEQWTGDAIAIVFRPASVNSDIPASGHRNMRKRIVALPFCNLRLKAAKSCGKSYPQKVLTLGDVIRKHRLDLGLFQKDVAKIIGYCLQSIVNWENGWRSPHINHLGKVVQFLAYDPFTEGTTLAERLVSNLKARGMRQKDFALHLGIDPSTLASYEQGTAAFTKISAEIHAASLSALTLIPSSLQIRVTFRIDLEIFAPHERGDARIPVAPMRFAVGGRMTHFALRVFA